jgi:uncharacterized membrane protein
MPVYCENGTKCCILVRKRLISLTGSRRLLEPNMAQKHSSPARLEAFSDGVIAVIITIMVLELKVPHENGVGGLRHVLPVLLVYLMSFTFTGIYWLNHHDLLHRVKHVDYLVLYANLAFLFTLSLLPFFTSYVLEKEIDAFSVALYSGAMIVIGMSFALLRLAINRILCQGGEIVQEDVATQRKHLLSLAIYVIAVPLAFWNPRIAMATISLVTLFWILPTLGIAIEQT